ncbi:DUF4097 family beta strand repeat-containing protein [Streptomyces beigongshangae]|uniref:DUF4097 family beta strand repeat-containing protein n=1 Tax=Streptomyces beigongshangae TaxID=2841597 RepID=UPI001C84CEE1|nr:DUF4097 family beta strand repeat-containing protein [Streptomyces sp. REN17]
MSGRQRSRNSAGRGRRRFPAVVGVGVVAVALGLLASGCGNSAEDDTEPEKRSFTLSGRALTVDSDGSALELVVGDVGKVQVTRWFKADVVLGEDPGITWAMKDGTLKLRTHCAGVVADCSAKHRIVVPRGVALTVEERDGGVRATGFEEALDIRASDGSVRVEDASGPLTLRTADGSVHASGIGSRRVDVRTEDGSARLEFASVPDQVSARGKDGSLTIGLPDAAYKVTAGARDGSVDVSVPRDEDSPHVVSAHTEDGKVTVRTAN